MAFSFYIPLAAASLLVFTLSCVHSTEDINFPVNEVNQTVSDEEPYNSTTNSTLNGFQTTEYLIVDFAKLGYELFKQKLFQALAMLDTFMEMKPMVIKITKTYSFGNDTDSAAEQNETNTATSELNMISDELQDGQSKYEVHKQLETNTESPLKEDSEAQLNKKVDSTDEFINKHDEFTVGPTHQESRDENDEKHYINDSADITQSKVEDEGFFGKLIHAVGNVFHSIWNWL